jgi:hypothetical protein
LTVDDVVMKERMRRTFAVDAPLETVWDYIARPEAWPATWAHHIRRVACDPHGVATAETRGVIHMKGGMSSKLRMIDFNPGRNWKWGGRSRIFRFAFDHRFDRIDEERTRLDFVVETDGALDYLLGPLTGLYLGRRLDRNIPRLIEQLDSLAGHRDPRSATGGRGRGP